MKWSYRLGSWFGVAVEVHVTFLLLLGWIAWSLYSSTGSVAHVIAGMVMVLALFLCVLVHEYGHALTARRFGEESRRLRGLGGYRCGRRGGWRAWGLGGGCRGCGRRYGGSIGH